MTATKVRITNIQRFNKDRDGKLLKTKDGRSYTRVRIQVEEYPDKWISGFENFQTKTWEIGDEAELIISENQGYLNFKIPSEIDELKSRLGELEIRVKALEQK